MMPKHIALVVTRSGNYSAGLIILIIVWGLAPMSSADLSGFILPECDFAALETNTGGQNECSPISVIQPFDSEFRGIVINGPKQMVWPKGAEPQEAGPWGSTRGPARLMIAGYYRLPESTLGLDGEFKNQVLFVAVNQTTHMAYSGKVPKFGKRYKRKDDRFSENDPNRIKGGAVNADLVNICGVPITNATYTVYATLGEYKSNVLTIKTVVK
jgi:hypothetical protein